MTIDLFKVGYVRYDLLLQGADGFTHINTQIQILICSITLRILIICLYSWNYTLLSKSSQWALLYEKVSVTSGVIILLHSTETIASHLEDVQSLGVRATCYPGSLNICCHISNSQCQRSVLNGGSLSSSDGSLFTFSPRSSHCFLSFSALQALVSLFSLLRCCCLERKNHLASFCAHSN